MLKEFGFILAKVLLTPISLIYGFVQFVRRGLYHTGVLRSQDLPGTVISIGNIEAGGTGKTPVVIALAKWLQEEGFTPVILTRGYRSGLKSHETAILVNEVTVLQTGSSEFSADEAQQQSADLSDVPVVIGANRLEGAKTYLRNFKEPTHWILDDGFQHLKISRNIDILLLDYDHPFGNGFPIPSGHLREFPFTKRFADIICFTRGPERLPDPKSICIPFLNNQFTKVAGPDTGTSPKQGNFLVLSGIAKPAKLMETLARLGVNTSNHIIIGDHERFAFQEFIGNLNEFDGIITTRKDFYRQKLEFIQLNKPVYVLELTADISQLTSALTTQTK
ncbi:MAG: tetraacyldisaccharide 4'-kinase [Pseudobacteriovorax sp.]|nr:tetraacyldisaccharide 4'-kinase [Pseudobacteriovorax sp.]